MPRDLIGIRPTTPTPISSARRLARAAERPRGPGLAGASGGARLGPRRVRRLRNRRHVDRAAAAAAADRRGDARFARRRLRRRRRRVATGLADGAAPGGPSPSHRSAATAARPRATSASSPAGWCRPCAPGAASAPLSATSNAGRAAPADAGNPVSVSSASSVAVARSTLAVTSRSAPAARNATLEKRAWPAAMLIAASACDTCSRALSSTPVTNSRMRLPSVGMPSSTARTTASNTPGLRPASCARIEPDTAGAGERTDERRRAAAGALELGLQT